MRLSSAHDRARTAQGFGRCQLPKPVTQLHIRALRNPRPRTGRFSLCRPHLSPPRDQRGLASFFDMSRRTRIPSEFQALCRIVAASLRRRQLRWYHKRLAVLFFSNGIGGHQRYHSRIAVPGYREGYHKWRMVPLDMTGSVHAERYRWATLIPLDQCGTGKLSRYP